MWSLNICINIIALDIRCACSVVSAYLQPYEALQLEDWFFVVAILVMEYFKSIILIDDNINPLVSSKETLIH